jgi:AraC-like DNA-binding protein
MSRGLDARVLGRHFGLECAPSVVAGRQSRSAITVTLLESEATDHAPTATMSCEDGFLFGLHLRPCGDRDLWIDGERIETQPVQAGSFVTHDLRRSTRWHLRSAFSALCIHLGRNALDTLTDEAGQGRVRDFVFEPGRGIADRTMYELGLLLEPALRQRQQASRLFCESLILALCGQLVQTHADRAGASPLYQGGLASWQERRAKEMLDANITGNIQVAALAQECGLSVSQFSRSFRKTTGLAPHQWLTHRRVELARTMLPDNALPLSQVSLICGFADQSHFTRVFPALWAPAPEHGGAPAGEARRSCRLRPFQGRRRE